MGFYEARNACASFGSNVILANLDKYFYEIQEYVYNFRRDQQIWVDASRPTSGKYSVLFLALARGLSDYFLSILGGWAGWCFLCMLGRQCCLMSSDVG